MLSSPSEALSDSALGDMDPEAEAAGVVRGRGRTGGRGGGRVQG